MAKPLWTGIKTLDELRNKAAFESTGVIQVTIEQLNKIGDEINHIFNQSSAPLVSEEGVKCERCGCEGNMSCGHKPLDKDKGCTLGRDFICPCCRIILTLFETLKKEVAELKKHGGHQSCDCEAVY